MPANAKAWPPTPIERRQFGDLADDIAFLRRGCGLTVARYRDDFRIGTTVTDLDIVSESALATRAARERARRQA